MRARAAGVALAIAGPVAIAAGCASSASEASPTVLAAASLVEALPEIEPGARYSFAGSNTIATQVRAGAPADVIAAASVHLAEDLHAEGLVDEPRVFATNRLVLLVPKGNPARVKTLADLDREQVTFLMADAGVPAGDYARRFLASAGRAHLADAAASQESDVRAVTQKVALREADAGFAYATDAAVAGDDVETVGLPAAHAPRIEYAVALVSGSERRAAAEAYVMRLLSPEGRAALAGAGFGSA